MEQAREQAVGHLPRVGVYFDDKAVTGETKQEHLANLNSVLERLNKEVGFKLRGRVFFKPLLPILVM